MKNNNYTKEELEETVKSYLEMRQKEIAGESFVKKKYYQYLSTKFSRSWKSYEKKMQNISYVFSLMGRDWVKGLTPMKNVGSNVFREIEEIIAALENKIPNDYASFQNDVVNSRKNTKKIPPIGSKKPKKSLTSSTKYLRDPEVVAWVLNFGYRRKTCMASRENALCELEELEEIGQLGITIS